MLGFSTLIIGALGVLAAPTVFKLAAIIIRGIIKMVQHVVAYFKGLALRKGKDVPFIADANIKELIDKAPVKNVGIFEATYDEETNEIKNYRVLDGDDVDDKIKEIMGKEKLVVLS